MIDYEKLFCENVEKNVKEKVRGNCVCKVLNDTLVINISSNGFTRDWIGNFHFSEEFAKGTITSYDVTDSAVRNFRKYVIHKFFNY